MCGEGGRTVSCLIYSMELDESFVLLKSLTKDEAVSLLAQVGSHTLLQV